MVPLADSHALKVLLNKFSIVNELAVVEGMDHRLMLEEGRGEEFGKGLMWVEKGRFEVWGGAGWAAGMIR